MIREVTEKLNSKAVSQKKISRVNEGIESIIGLIDYLNNWMGDEDVEIWPGHTIDEVLIPREFADFVYPATIRYDASDRRTANLLVRDKSDNLCPKTYQEYMDACDAFRGNFKRDASSDMVSVASLRKHVNLSDVDDRISINGRVSYYNSFFVPIPVKDISVLFEADRYLNDTASAVLEDYVAEMRFTN